MATLSSLEICAGGGGQALGLEMAGFEHVALVENDHQSCETLRLNRPKWNVIEGDLRQFKGASFKGIDLLAGGVPCPPFSIAGKQLGAGDERDLFPEALRLVDECRPKAVMLENVRGLLDPAFQDYRKRITRTLKKLGYVGRWALLNACDFGVPQLRPRVVMVAVTAAISDYFEWPKHSGHRAPTVGRALYPLMSSRGWHRVDEWRDIASGIAPTIVGGSKKHGGPDLGPTRAKRAWAQLGVNGHLIGDLPPEPDFVGMPVLTVPMVARLQGFSKRWAFSGKKTPAYRQVGNAFPPPVARAVGYSIQHCFEKRVVKTLLPFGSCDSFEDEGIGATA
ncbi:MAG: Cytosine-specific methyltransferase [Candidatus Sulfotelmatobacter sp.]|nr:Cytosine-specific methyltransferase [Candidatus Sulfotelmatobacter sp.]